MMSWSPDVLMSSSPHVLKSWSPESLLDSSSSMYDHSYIKPTKKLGLNFSFKLVVVIVQITLGKESIVVLLGQFQINYDLPMMIAEERMYPAKWKFHSLFYVVSAFYHFSSSSKVMDILHLILCKNSRKRNN